MHMTTEELRDLLHKLHLDYEAEPNLIYLFFENEDGTVDNFSISIRSARQRNRRPMSDEQVAQVAMQYPAVQRGKLLAIERPDGSLTQWIDSVEVCQRLHISRQTLRRWVKRGLLVPSVMGRRHYFDPAEVEQLLRSNIIQENGRIDKTGLV